MTAGHPAHDWPEQVAAAANSGKTAGNSRPILRADDHRNPQGNEGAGAPGGDDAGVGAGTGQARPPGAGGNRRRRGLRATATSSTSPPEPEIVADAAAVFGGAELIVKVKEPQPAGTGAAGAAPHAVHLPPPGRQPGTDRETARHRLHRARLRDARGERPPAAARADERDRRPDVVDRRQLPPGEAPRRARRAARRRARRGARPGGGARRRHRRGERGPGRPRDRRRRDDPGGGLRADALPRHHDGRHPHALLERGQPRPSCCRGSTC